MDPLTQGVVGALAAVIPIPESDVHRDEIRPALIAGALAGMAADADVFIRSAEDPLLFLDYHRHFTHSLAFIPLGAAVVWAVLWPVLRRFFPDRASGRRRLYLYCLLGYATHGLLDACTSYGTRLFWPFAPTRVAWNVVSVVDPLFTVPLLALILLAAVRRTPRWARMAVCLGLVYLAWGTVQRDRAEALLERVAAAHGHEMVRSGTKPGFGNLVLWRGLYGTADDRLHAVALRPGFLEPSKVSPVASAPHFDPETDLSGLDPASRQARDIDRFDHFSDGWLVRLEPDTERTLRLGDFRYAAVPDEIRPLWGIRVDLDQPREHVEYLNLREIDPADRDRFFCMLRGDCLEPVE